MKRIFSLFFIFLFCSAAAHAKIKIVATLPVLGALAQEIGGDQVEVTVLVKPNQDPHFLEPKPSYVVSLSKADLLIQAGMELEAGWLPPALVQSRNPKIQSNAAGDFDASQGISPLEVPSGKIDRSLGDVHPQGNPHYWLDPRNMILIGQKLTETLGKMDAASKTLFESNFQNFSKNFQAKIQGWNTQLSKLRGKKVIAYHKSLNYFADWSGLQVVASVEPKPGIPPNSKHVEELLTMIPQQSISAILFEEFYPQKVPEYLAQKSGVPAVMLSTQPVEIAAGGLAKFYEELVQKISQAVK